jgi:hypothetical protein
MKAGYLYVLSLSIFVNNNAVIHTHLANRQAYVRMIRADCDQSRAHVDRNTFFPSKDKTFIGRPALHVMEYPRADGMMGSPAVHSVSSQR